MCMLIMRRVMRRSILRRRSCKIYCEALSNVLMEGIVDGFESAGDMLTQM